MFSLLCFLLDPMPENVVFRKGQCLVPIWTYLLLSSMKAQKKLHGGINPSCDSNTRLASLEHYLEPRDWMWGWISCDLQTKSGCVSAFGSLLLSFLFLVGISIGFVCCLVLFGLLSGYCFVWLALIGCTHYPNEKLAFLCAQQCVTGALVWADKKNVCVFVFGWLLCCFGLFVCRCLGSCSLISGTVQHWDTWAVVQKKTSTNSTFRNPHGDRV